MSEADKTSYLNSQFSTGSIISNALEAVFPRNQVSPEDRELKTARTVMEDALAILFARHPHSITGAQLNTLIDGSKSTLAGVDTRTGGLEKKKTTYGESLYNNLVAGLNAARDACENPQRMAYTQTVNAFEPAAALVQQVIADGSDAVRHELARKQAAIAAYRESVAAGQISSAFDEEAPGEARDGGTLDETDTAKLAGLGETPSARVTGVEVDKTQPRKLRRFEDSVGTRGLALNRWLKGNLSDLRRTTFLNNRSTLENLTVAALDKKLMHIRNAINAMNDGDNKDDGQRLYDALVAKHQEYWDNKNAKAAKDKKFRDSVGPGVEWDNGGVVQSTGRE